MADQQIVSCPGCGKRYSVPPGVPPGQFQCQDCSAVVVYGQKGEGGGGRTHSADARRHAKAAAAKRRLQRERAHRADFEDEDEGDDRRHRQEIGKQKKDPVFYLLGFFVLAVVVGGSIYFLASTGGEKKRQPAVPQLPGRSGGTAPLPTEGAEAQPPAGGGAETAPPPAAPRPAAGGGGGEDGEEPKPASGGGLKAAVRGPGSSKPDTYKPADNPPTGGNYGKSQNEIKVALQTNRASIVTDLEHLPDTPAELRSKIDADVSKMVDPNAGGEGLRAQDRLIKAGRAAIPRVLGASSRLDFSKYTNIVDAANDCFVADAIDNVLREITGYETPPRLQYTPQSKVSDYVRNTEEWYVWWLTLGYKRATFYKSGADEEEKL